MSSTILYSSKLPTCMQFFNLTQWRSHREGQRVMSPNHREPYFCILNSDTGYTRFQIEVVEYRNFQVKNSLNRKLVLVGTLKSSFFDFNNIGIV